MTILEQIQKKVLMDSGSEKLPNKTKKEEGLSLFEVKKLLRLN